MGVLGASVAVRGVACRITSESSALPSVARLANSSAVCSRLIRGVRRREMSFPINQTSAIASTCFGAAVVCGFGGGIASRSSVPMANRAPFIAIWVVDWISRGWFPLKCKHCSGPGCCPD